MLLNSIPTLLLKHATLKINQSSGDGTKLTVGVYHNGMGGICMLMSTGSNHWDIIPRHLSDLDLHKK